ncbi:MAG: DNA (cytosine-5-)-methyltransferase [Methanobacteriota archaeon]|nr:MAG: DNA (cytosine-5-)-methyltransferase [Euryarchaeota archaeon]
MFKFIDLFAGIGGLRLACERNGGYCVFTSEINRFSAKTYLANFPDSIVLGDISEIDEDDIPYHDILVAGFPCQPFSIAGVSKRNSLGRKHGFEDKTQGTLFFDVARILERKRPRCFVLENVKNLVSHDSGNTMKTILDVLVNELGYHVSWKVMDASRFVPQKRERTVIVGTTDAPFDFDSLDAPDEKPKMKDILHPEDGSEKPEPPYTEGPLAKVSDRYVLSDRLWGFLQSHALKHQKKGNGFGYGLVGQDDVARTLTARYYKDGSEILVKRNDGNPRKLTPRECARLMGFPDDFKIPVSDTQAYRQFGNSVVVPLFERVVKKVIEIHMQPFYKQTFSP